MTLIGCVLGFSLFGLGARLGQLGIQKRNLFDNPGAHVISMGVFGFVGYWAHQWDDRAAVLIAAKRAQIAERRKAQVERAEAVAGTTLAEAS